MSPEDGLHRPPDPRAEDDRAAAWIAMVGLSTLDLDDLLKRLVAGMVEIGRADAGAILLLDEEARTLIPGAYHGFAEEAMRGLRIPVGEGFAGRVASERRPVVVLDVANQSVFINPHIRQQGIKSILGVPIAVGERLLGVAHIDSRASRGFSPGEIARLEGMAAQAALAIQHAILHRRLTAANQELAAANRRLQTVIETSPAGMAIMEASEGRIVSANRAAEALWGISPVAEAGFADLQRAFGFYHLNGEPYECQDLPMVRSVRRGETVAGEELIVKRADGKEHITLVSSAPLRDDDGQIEGAVMLFQDTSGMNLQRLKDEFTAVTAHELFTPLTIIKGAAQLLAHRMEQEGDRDAVSALRVIDGRTNWMAHLLQKLADSSELRLDSLQLRRSKTDPAALAGLVGRRFQTTTDRHEIVVVDHSEGTVGNWDRARIDRVLSNLVDNAIKYSPDGGRVEIGIKRTRLRNPFDTTSPEGEGNWLLVRVTDQGVGIAKEEQAHLFRRFYRGGPVRREEVAGLGLGLYIANRIVVAHGGQMCLESEPGRGSTFYFSLPLDGEGAVPGKPCCSAA